MTSGFFPNVPKNSDFSQHSQFCCNIVQNACETRLEKQIMLWIINTNYSF